MRDDLPEPLQQGLFAQRPTYPLIVRLALGPGELLADSVPPHRGMAMKILGVEGPKVPGHENAVTQDLVLATGPVFPAADAAAFLQSMQGLEKVTPRSEGLKRAVSTTARVFNTAIGGRSATLAFYGHPRLHPLADSYYSQAALRHGDYIAKIAVVPVSPELQALKDTKLDVGRDADAFRHAVVAFMRDHAAELELRAQLCTDLDAMPVEDASKAWPEDASPYLPVARLILPPSDAYSEARQSYVDDVLAFRPARSLEAHRPLGSLMRARLKTYKVLSVFRTSATAKPSTSRARSTRCRIEPSHLRRAGGRRPKGSRAKLRSVGAVGVTGR